MKKIESTTENWTSGALGHDEQYVQVSTVDNSSLDDLMGLKPVSIRLQKSLIDELKAIAQIHQVGYQSLIKQTLRRFADSEMKRLLRELACETMQKEAQKKDEADASEEREPPAPRRRMG